MWTCSPAGVKAILITDNLQHSMHGFFKFKVNLPYTWPHGIIMFGFVVLNVMISYFIHFII